MMNAEFMNDELVSKIEGGLQELEETVIILAWNCWWTPAWLNRNMNDNDECL